MQSQQTINKKGENVEMQGKGRHDPCVVPRAVPIVEAMAALVLADLTLLDRVVKSNTQNHYLSIDGQVCVLN